MIRDITLGQFVPGKSILHRIDPRVKLLLTFLVIVFLFVAGNFISMGLMVAFVLLAMILSGVSLRLYLKSMKAILFIVIFTSLLNLFYGSGEPLVQLGFLKITLDGILRAAYISLRIICLVFISSVLTFTTSPTDLTDALERLMKPLRYIKVPVHEIAMMMTIALRFVPTLLEETDKIMSAQKARGADLESGGIFQRIRALVPILIPLFVSAFRRAYDLAMAMECRCYHGGDGRTKMKQLHLRSHDYTIIAVTICVCAGVILINIFLPGMV